MRLRFLGDLCCWGEDEPVVYAVRKSLLIFHDLWEDSTFIKRNFYDLPFCHHLH